MSTSRNDPRIAFAENLWESIKSADLDEAAMRSMGMARSMKKKLRELPRIAAGPIMHIADQMIAWLELQAEKELRDQGVSTEEIDAAKAAVLKAEAPAMPESDRPTAAPAPSEEATKPETPSGRHAGVDGQKPREAE